MNGCTDRGLRATEDVVGAHPPPDNVSLTWPQFLRILKRGSTDGASGLLFPGDRSDHMSVRYLMDRFRPARAKAGRPDLTIHHFRHTAPTIAGQHGATAAELQARAGHVSQAAMAIYQHATLDRDKRWPIRSAKRTTHGSRNRGQ